jgi:glycerophosphoryl diester phosphodiesterase
MGRYLENTMEGFRKAVNLGVGIESDVQLTKDNNLVCFHDKSFKVAGKWHDISKMTLEEIRSLKFVDKRVIPTVPELLETFMNENSNLRFSFDIRSSLTGIKLIDLILQYNLLYRVEITDRRLPTLKKIRNYHEEAKLVHTVPEKIKLFDDKKLDFTLLEKLKIDTLNIVSWRANHKNLKSIIDNGIKCYVWGVNNKSRMKRLFSFNYQNKGVSAIYTDYPDTALKIQAQILGETLK